MDSLIGFHTMPGQRRQHAPTSLCQGCMPPPHFGSPRSGELRTQKLKSHLVRTELKRSLFKAWSTSVYSHTCYAYCQGFLPCFFLPSCSIHLHFFQNLSRFFLCLLWLTHGSCVGLQNRIGSRVEYPWNINRLKKA